MKNTDSNKKKNLLETLGQITSDMKKTSIESLNDNKHHLRNLRNDVFNYERIVAEQEEYVLSTATVERHEEIGRFHIVQVVLKSKEKNYYGTGISRRSEYDTDVPNLGYEIAYGRAIKSLRNAINKTVDSRDPFIG